TVSAFPKACQDGRWSHGAEHNVTHSRGRPAKSAGLGDRGEGLASGEAELGEFLTAGPGVERLQIERHVLAGLPALEHLARLLAGEPEHVVAEGQPRVRPGQSGA